MCLVDQSPKKEKKGLAAKKGWVQKEKEYAFMCVTHTKKLSDMCKPHRE